MPKWHFHSDDTFFQERKQCLELSLDLEMWLTNHHRQLQIQLSTAMLEKMFCETVKHVGGQKLFLTRNTNHHLQKAQGKCSLIQWAHIASFYFNNSDNSWMIAQSNKTCWHFQHKVYNSWGGSFRLPELSWVSFTWQYLVTAFGVCI